MKAKTVTVIETDKSEDILARANKTSVFDSLLDAVLREVSALYAPFIYQEQK